MERFWTKVAKAGPDDCWPWTGGLTHGTWGYGRLTIARRHVVAHRVAWELVNGPIPDGLKVLHSCDNPPCCNPAHLHLGTQAENLAEMLARGRHGRASMPGARNPAARLTEEQVVAIRAAYPRLNFRQIAAEFGIGKSQAFRIVRGKSWTDPAAVRDALAPVRHTPV